VLFRAKVVNNADVPIEKIDAAITELAAKRAGAIAEVFSRKRKPFSADFAGLGKVSVGVGHLEFEMRDGGTLRVLYFVSPG
jgi:hypothetical protein